MSDNVIRIAAAAAALALSASVLGQSQHAPVPGSNPLISDKFTADPAPLVIGDRLYFHVGHDEAKRDKMFNMREWLVHYRHAAMDRSRPDNARRGFQVGEAGRPGFAGGPERRQILVLRRSPA